MDGELICKDERSMVFIEWQSFSLVFPGDDGVFYLGKKVPEHEEFAQAKRKEVNIH